MQIRYVVDVKSLEDNVSSFKAYGQSGDTRIVEARLALRHFNLADQNKALATADSEVVDAMKKRWHLLKPTQQKTNAS